MSDPGETTLPEAAPERPGPAEQDDGVLLRVDDITVQFGGVTALDQINFEVRRGEIFGLIGPNGAGKTTCST